MKEQLVWKIAQNIMPEHATCDDAYHEALHEAPPQTRLYTVDTFVEGQHFSLQWQTPRTVAWRCLAAAVSDIAACGGTPLGWLLGLTLPATYMNDTNFITQLYQGFQEATQAFAPDLQLWGGDTTTGTEMVINITVIGQALHPVSLKRGHAAVGDVVITNGMAGLAHVGWKAHEANRAAEFPNAIEAFNTPTPKLAAGQLLATHCATHALMDTSDGLADAALKIAHASGVSIQLDEVLLPVHCEVPQALRSGLIPDIHTALLYGGEDFNLLGCISKQQWQQHGVALEQAGFYRIGDVHAMQESTPNACIRLLNGEVKPLSFDRTYQHFTPEAID
jgi:thiamine-monophosphate kinase